MIFNRGEKQGQLCCRSNNSEAVIRAHNEKLD